MKRICVVPYWNSGLENKFFRPGNTLALHQACYLWQQLAAKEGFALDTIDICPPQEADAVWLMDLPRKRRFFEELKGSLRDSTKIILQQFESPLITPQSHESKNQSECDFILTYSQLRSADPRVYHYRIPNYLDFSGSDTPFSERRCVVMINSNKKEGWFGSGGVGSTRFPGVGKFITGWHTSVAKLLNPARGELYSWRRKFARAAEECQDRALDIYGAGWQGDPITWLPVSRPRPYRNAAGDLLVDPDKVAKYHHKIALIANYRFGVATENYRGTKGYISEKLFDVLRAGSVPIYLGEESISDILPPGAFVDARKFKDHGMLLNYLMNCPENEWKAMRLEGQSFLSSKSAKQFSRSTFAETAMEILRKIS